jgi:hypothetical protein
MFQTPSSAGSRQRDSDKQAHMEIMKLVHRVAG